MALQELVFAYKSKPTSLLKNQILTHSIPLVKSIVSKIKSPQTPLWDREDLVNIGTIGLLQALESYSPDKDVQFNTFAYYRIRGSIIDYLRSADELSRTNRSRYGAVQQAINDLQQRLGRAPHDFEVATEIGMNIKDYYKLLTSVQQRVALSLDMDFSSDSDHSLLNRIENNNIELPDQGILNHENSQQLKNAIQKLSERERIILALYYYEEYTLREIAETLSLSEARISQIIGKLLLTLKSSLQEYALV